MKKILIAGNWKMNTNPFESKKLAEYIAGGINNKNLKVKVLVCPPFTSLDAVSGVVNNTQVLLGAQNCHFEAKGAFTGEVSIPMLKYLGCSYVIIGHSERREYFNETNELVNKKTINALEREFKPIVCIGETLEERKTEKTFEVLEKQIREGLKNVSREQALNLTIAYEPVWAIGTGLAATPEQVQETHSFIRKLLKELFGGIGEDALILYGGSMKPENAKELLELKDVNGGLIGGASLKPESFLAIIASAQLIADN